MGGHAYWHFVPFEASVQRALDRLRMQEFAAGRYNPVIRAPHDGTGRTIGAAPGARHDSIEEACRAAGDEGTRSILDIARVSDAPDYGVAAPLAEEVLIDAFGSERPTHEMIARRLVSIMEDIERGQCVYIVAYADDKPTEIFFGGYSYD
jgi:hypothetical protein